MAAQLPPKRTLVISANESKESAAKLQNDVSTLLERKWRLTADGKGVERVVRFRTFGDCWVSSNLSCLFYLFETTIRTLHHARGNGADT